MGYRYRLEEIPCAIHGELAPIVGLAVRRRPAAGLSDPAVTLYVVYLGGKVVAIEIAGRACVATDQLW